ncbi:hypothetical protein [Kitasatospora sp. NBC_01266]|uniref:hypothetical protein n=1 Tax=Kitasatospora sp. NBC_01266 TaxID=2903572 RepID=UPI002E33EDE8|nr:hypothetical protein [Kitasatospora sp. NBC_01266]
MRVRALIGAAALAVAGLILAAVPTAATPVPARDAADQVVTPADTDAGGAITLMDSAWD